MKYYAVRKGRKTGIFTTWEETAPLVQGFKGAEYKSFNTCKEAEDYISTNTNSSNKEEIKEIKEKETNNLPIINPNDKKITIINREEKRQGSNKNVGTQILEGIWNTVKDSVVGNAISEENKERRTIYTDGSCVGKVGGYGFVIVRKDEYMEPFYGKVPLYPCTNQIAELYAILKALQHGFSMYPYSTGFDLYTDSKYAIGCLTEWYPNWEKNDWRTAKGEAVANKGLIQDILKLILANKNTCPVTFHHVYGHTGNKYNEICDMLANQGRV